MSSVDERVRKIVIEQLGVKEDEVKVLAWEGRYWPRKIRESIEIYDHRPPSTAEMDTNCLQSTGPCCQVTPYPQNHMV